jgi:hypothetical protein
MSLWLTLHLIETIAGREITLPTHKQMSLAKHVPNQSLGTIKVLFSQRLMSLWLTVHLIETMNSRTTHNLFGLRAELLFSIYLKIQQTKF